MAANTSPIFPLTPYIVTADLTAATACTTRAPTVTASLAGANILPLTAVSTNGLRIDRIQVKGSSTSITAPTASQLVQIWDWDGTKAYLIDEIQVSLITPSTTAASFQGMNVYNSSPTNTLVLPATHALYVSTTITTTASTTALIVTLFGGQY